MEIILITSDKSIENETQLITEMFQNGLKRLHIRKPKSRVDEVKAFIQQIPIIYHHQIVLHQHFELLTKFNLYGFHITQYNKQWVQDIKKLIEPHQSLSISCHSFNEISETPGYDYYFISPVFNSISKKDYTSNFNASELKDGLQVNKPKRIVALGGISPDNILQLKSIGFDSAAVLGGVWENENPVSQFLKLQKQLL